jgi:rhodanese-related sulfurtransferase
MIDFFSSRLGCFPRPADARPLESCLAQAATKAEQLSDGRVRALFGEMCEHLAREVGDAQALTWRAPLRVAPATSPSFSAHGTAMAGLIGARPRGAGEVQLMGTRHIGGGNGQPAPLVPEPVSLPYVGVDPFCQVIPISTSFDPDPEQLILAMLYAWLVDADVIVLARDFADPSRMTMDHTAAGPEMRLDSYPVHLEVGELELWDALHDLTLDVSRRVAVVCAAGNGTDEPMIYPASLARADNGIIAVGARAASGRRAAYSSISDPTYPGDGVTIYAPSGDGERLDSMIQRLDTADSGFRPSDQSASYVRHLGVHHSALPPRYGNEVAADSIFATQEIISTDVPGAAGYNSSLFARPASAAGEILDYRSYYCHFSGTSAACAIAAGAISLAISAGAVDARDPVSIKSRLRGDPAIQDDRIGVPRLNWETLTLG